MNTRVSGLENFFPYNYIDRIEQLYYVGAILIKNG